MHRYHVFSFSVITVVHCLIAIAVGVVATGSTAHDAFAGGRNNSNVQQQHPSAAPSSGAGPNARPALSSRAQPGPPAADGSNLYYRQYQESENSKNRSFNALTNVLNSTKPCKECLNNIR